MQVKGREIWFASNLFREAMGGGKVQSHIHSQKQKGAFSLVVATTESGLLISHHKLEATSDTTKLAKLYTPMFSSLA